MKRSFILCIFLSCYNNSIIILIKIRIFPNVYKNMKEILKNPYVIAGIVMIL